LLIFNFNELNQKHQRRRKEKKKEVMVAYFHHLLHGTIEEGDNIVAITFFATKPSKMATIVAIVVFCNKTI